MPSKKFTLSEINRVFENLTSEGIEASLVRDIQQRLVMHLQERAEGVVEGRLKFGYRREDKSIVIDEESATTIRYIERRRRENASLQRIAEELNAAQRSTAQRGHKWFASSIHSILKNQEAYRGNSGWPRILDT